MHRGFLIALSFVVNPWLFWIVNFFLNFKLVFNPTSLRVINYTLFLFISVISFLYTYNVAVIVQSLAYFYLINLRFKNFKTPRVSKGLVLFIRLYLISGFGLALFKFLLLNERLGLFWSEINFSGYLILIFIYIIFSLDRLRYLDVLIWLSFIIITGSRAFLIMSILSIIFYNARNSKFFIAGILSLMIISFVLFDFMIEKISYLPLFRPTGYVDDYSRLYQLYDSSSIERFRIVADYYRYFQLNWFDFLFGSYISQKEAGLMESHNSFLQRIFEYGVLSTIMIVYVMLKRLDFWLFSLIIIYGFFLHNLYSLPILICLLAYGKRSNCYSTNL